MQCTQEGRLWILRLIKVGEVLSVLMTRGGVLGGAMVISSAVGYAIVVVVAAAVVVVVVVVVVGRRFLPVDTT